MKISNISATGCIVVLCTASLVSACDSDSDGGDNTAGTQRCENNVLEKYEGDAWVAVTDCTETFEWCALDDAGVGSCGTETSLCEDAAQEEWICFGDYTVTCNTSTSQGDVFRSDCADATGDPANPGECYNYGGVWGADCMIPEGGPCINATLGVFLGCGADGVLDPNLACDQVLGCVAISDGYCNGESSGCDGNTLIYCDAPDTLNALAVNIAFTCDNTNYGSGTCTPDALGPGEAACVHETTGGLCLPGLVECGGSLTCNTETGQCE